MTAEQAIFEQDPISNLEMWGSTALNTLSPVIATT